MIRSTSTVIIATVITRFVAILAESSARPSSFSYHHNIREQVPTRHPPQRLHTPLHIPLTLQQAPPRMLNRLPLRMQIRQRPPPDILRLQRDPLALPQPVRATIQSVGAREELLPLLELVVGSGGIVGVAVSEERFAV